MFGQANDKTVDNITVSNYIKPYLKPNKIEIIDNSFLLS